MGKRTKYDPDTFPLIAEGAARDKLCDDEICTLLGIKRSAYYDYQNKYPEFADAIKRGKRPVNVMLENATMKSALGYEVTETHTEVIINEQGELTGERKVKTIKKHIPGSVTAQIWLESNRMPEKYKQRRSHEFTNSPFDKDLMQKCENEIIDAARNTSK